MTPATSFPLSPSLPAAILTWLSMLYVPDHCVLVAWLTNFGYLIM